jgi:hypothetical protein
MSIDIIFSNQYNMLYFWRVIMRDGTPSRCTSNCAFLEGNDRFPAFFRLDLA